MKKVILSLLVFAATAASAQYYVGGTVGFKSQTEPDATSFKIVPEVGYQLSDKWAIGLTLGYGQTKAGDVTNKALGAGAYARYTAAKFGPVKILLDGGFEYVSTKVGDNDADNGFQIGIAPAISVDLVKNLSFVSHVGFLGYKDNLENAKSSFGLDLDATALTFGLYYNF